MAYRKWTPKLAQRRSLDRLLKMDAMLIEIAGQYGDIHQGICDRCDDLRRELEGFQEEVRLATEEVIEADNWR